VTVAIAGWTGQDWTRTEGVRAAVGDFRSMRATELLRVLTRPPLGYRIDRQTGSHRRMVSSSGFPPLTFAFHDGDSLPPGLVRKILVRDIGLAEDEARRLL